MAMVMTIHIKLGGHDNQHGNLSGHDNVVIIFVST